MKKLFLILLLFSELTFAQDVRGCYWGMFPQDVISQEQREPDKIDAFADEISITYKNLEFEGKRANVYYEFKNSKLESATIAIIWGSKTVKSKINRLNSFKAVFNSFYYKGFLINQNWVVGTYYSAIYLTERNRLYKSTLSFPIKSNEDLSSIARNINIDKVIALENKNSDDYCHYGITMSNNRTNVFIQFPLVGKKSKYSGMSCGQYVQDIIGWIKYSKND